MFTTATGTPLGARQIRKMFQDVCERAGAAMGAIGGLATRLRLGADGEPPHEVGRNRPLSGWVTRPDA